jgi:hypothetical protein
MQIRVTRIFQQTHIAASLENSGYTQFSNFSYILHKIL